MILLRASARSHGFPRRGTSMILLRPDNDQIASGLAGECSNVPATGTCRTSPLTRTTAPNPIGPREPLCALRSCGTGPTLPVLLARTAMRGCRVVLSRIYSTGKAGTATSLTGSSRRRISCWPNPGTPAPWETTPCSAHVGLDKPDPHPAQRLVNGTHPHVRSGDEYAEGRLRLVKDIAFHETVHQYDVEVLGKPEERVCGHGPVFRDECNRIGEALGLAQVRTGKARGSDRNSRAPPGGRSMSAPEAITWVLFARRRRGQRHRRHGTGGPSRRKRWPTGWRTTRNGPNASAGSAKGFSPAGLLLRPESGSFRCPGAGRDLPGEELSPPAAASREATAGPDRVHTGSVRLSRSAVPAAVFPAATGRAGRLRPSVRLEFASKGGADGH